MKTEATSKELVSSGHQLAKTLRSSHNMLDVANLISDLSTRLDCAFVRGNELQQKLDELAEENAVLLKLLTDISENHVEYFSEGEGYMFAGVPLDYVSEINMYASRDVNAENPFPATDSYINSVRAEGVEMLSGKLQQLIDEGTFDAREIGVAAGAVYTGDQISAQLRAGKDCE
ncbi:hypothetical protein [Mixta mediterraneensis]|uniref:hypothetical protein n=1 Tax=Mixta mediterraneensis TaxID=2758443 RepID=UPI00187356E6|nr:hypothetical protein [Mixta mediterraneensis]MBE5251592.1 hypothetical protein [Mixta mediterraneensis]